jgi:hypothetical protein
MQPAYTRVNPTCAPFMGDLFAARPVSVAERFRSWLPVSCCSPRLRWGSWSYADWVRVPAERSTVVGLRSLLNGFVGKGERWNF